MSIPHTELLTPFVVQVQIDPPSSEDITQKILALINGGAAHNDVIKGIKEIVDHAITSVKNEKYTKYTAPTGHRYGSKEMSYHFSPHNRVKQWRNAWIALAKAEKDLGLPISQEQIDELEAHVSDINFSAAEEHEKITKHDVMAHLHAYGDQCPLSKGILHLGATSCTITDNADGLIIREALQMIQRKLVALQQKLGARALEFKDLPCLGYTHFQAAQPVTVGARMALWLQSFHMNFKDVRNRLQDFPFLGLNGATGTQASFLELFDGSHEKVVELEEKFAFYMAYGKSFRVSGQTYPRLQDQQIMSLLSGIASSAEKMSTDLRLLAHEKEIEEPFGKNQTGSSAMPYKRNPITNENICSLSKFVNVISLNATLVASSQWLERSLDDSANRRLTIPQAFLAVDHILDSLIRISEDSAVYPKMIERWINEELPFMATENIMMKCVKEKGADRQAIHEIIRQHSVEVGKAIKEHGATNNLLKRLAEDPAIPLSAEEIEQVVDVRNFIGCAPQRTEKLVTEVLANMD